MIPLNNNDMHAKRVIQGIYQLIDLANGPQENAQSRTQWSSEIDSVFQDAPKFFYALERLSITVFSTIPQMELAGLIKKA